MSDDIFIKQDQVIGQQPYIAQSVKNAQEPNIRQQPSLVDRNAQQPSIYPARQPALYQDTRNAQEPNIRGAQEPNIRDKRSPFTYQHRSPLTYDHRSPVEYNHRSPLTYNHRSPSIAQVPNIVQQPSTYDHRSPFTYRDPRSKQSPYIATGQEPNIRSAQEPNIRDRQNPTIKSAQEPNIRNNQQPVIRDQQEPNIRDARQPFTYQHQSPSTYANRQPSIYTFQSPFTYNIQTPVTSQSPLYYSGIDGDTTGGSGGTSAGGYQTPNWDTTHQSQWPSYYSAQAFVTMAFAYQKNSGNSPWASSGVSGGTTGERGSVHLFYYGGTNSAYATLYSSIVSIGSNISGYPTGVSPGVDDTWAVEVKYEVTSQGNSGSGATFADYGKTAGTYYGIYTGSSSAGSYDGTATTRYFQAKASAPGAGGGSGGNQDTTNVSGLVFTIKLSKSGQTSIFTTHTVSTGGGGGMGFGSSVYLDARSGVPFL